MKISVKYLDNEIELNDEKITCIEIENKSYFYRLIKDLYSISNSENVENIIFVNNKNEEINYNNKISIILNYFDLELNSKKTNTDILKYISNNIVDEDKLAISKICNKLQNIYNNILNEIDIPLVLDTDTNIDDVTKIMKISIKTKDDLLSNLLLLIDINKVLNLNKLLVFVNLKQYLNKIELEELYKYSIYNKINIILVDSQSYGCTLENEQKLIIDEDLEEFML
jgi:CRISPR type II-A-associated protein Csn2